MHHLKSSITAWCSSLFCIFLLQTKLHAAPRQTPSQTTPTAIRTPAPSTEAPAPLTNLTAEDLLRLANRNLASGNWADAANAFLCFLKDFEDRQETALLVRKFRPGLALSLMRLGRFAEARSQLEKALTTRPPYPEPIQGELRFQNGLCAMQLNLFAEARKVFEGALPPLVEQAQSGATLPLRAQQIHLLIASCLLKEASPKEAAAYLSKVRQLLDPQNQTRAAALQFRALIDGESFEQAIQLYQTDATRLTDSRYLLTTQTLLLKLGDALLERGLNRQALVALRQIRPFEKILQLQDAALAARFTQAISQETRRQPEIANSLQSDPAFIESHTELQAFRALQNFDLSVHLRQAAAYQALQRPREAALVLEQSLAGCSQGALLDGAIISLVQCWCELERWEKALSLTSRFLQNIPQNVPQNAKQRSALTYFKGLSEQKSGLYAESLRTLDSLSQVRPQQESELRAEFAAAFTQLLADHPNDAATRFRLYLTRHPKHVLAEDASRWLCVALGFDKQHAACRTAADDYVVRFPEGEAIPLVLLQKARSTFALKLQSQAEAELHSWLTRFPQNDLKGEAALMLGDLLSAKNDTGAALASFAQIPLTQPRPFEEGFFKTAKLLQQTQQFPRLYAHLLHFPYQRPESPRLAEAVLWAAKSAESPDSGAPTHSAQELPFDVLRRLGNNPAAEGIEGIFDPLSKQNSTPELRAALLHRLTLAHTEASQSGNLCLSRRLLWAIGRAQLQANPTEAQAALLGAADKAPPDSTSPRLLADFADALAAANHPNEAKLLWLDLIKWHPVAAQKDRAFAFLAASAVAAGDKNSALGWIMRFQKECGKSPLSGSILLTKAHLQEASGNPKAARQTLDALLKERAITAEFKADALLLLADSHMRSRDPHTAIPYYQRVYVLYTRWPERVAKAYLRSGEAFEALGDVPAARRTYQEMLASTLPRLAEAQTRLDFLEGLE